MAGAAAVFPRLSLPAHSEAEKAAFAWAPFSLGALASGMGLALGLALLPAVAGGGRVGVDYWWTRDLYHLRLQADGLSLPAALAICALGLLVHLHLVGLRAAERSHQRAALLLAAQGSAMGAVLAADLMAVVFFLGLTVLCLWGLAATSAPREAERLLTAGYLGGLLVLAGALVMWQRADSTSVQDLPLLLLSAEPRTLGLIAALMLLGFLPFVSGFPAHGWLASLAPRSHSLALIPATLLLVVGATLVLRLLPGSLMLATAPGFARLSLVLGLVGLWWGALRAWFATELGWLAVWLTVAQAGQLLLAVSSSASPVTSGPAMQAAGLHLLAAPPAVLAVWCASSAVAARTGTDALAGLSGLWRRAPASGLALLAGGLSLAGFPPLVGFQVQRLLVSGLVEQSRPVLAAAVVLADVLLAVAVVSAFRRAFLRGEPPPPVRPAPVWLSVQLAALIAVLLALGVWASATARWGEMVSNAITLGPP